MAHAFRMGIGLVIGGWLLAGCEGGGAGPTVKALETVEVREYQGQNLSSIGDFRENSIKGPQNVSLDGYQLKITGLADKPLALTYHQVLAHDQYSKVVTLHCVEGWDVTILWEGVLIDDLLKDAQARPGALIAIFHAADGYTSSLTLDFIRQNKILLAYKMNGVTIPPERGFPFMVVAESKWGYKWVKWVAEIELSDNSNYRGYWESQGYNNNGDQSGPMFGP
jgi:DMSO/TMAO reductase YedYZ molybdopterin-dependent catalytic subunit